MTLNARISQPQQVYNIVMGQKLIQIGLKESSPTHYMAKHKTIRVYSIKQVT